MSDVNTNQEKSSLGACSSLCLAFSPPRPTPQLPLRLGLVSSSSSKAKKKPGEASDVRPLAPRSVTSRPPGVGRSRPGRTAAEDVKQSSGSRGELVAVEGVEGVFLLGETGFP